MGIGAHKRKKKEEKTKGRPARIFLAKISDKAKKKKKEGEKKEPPIHVFKTHTVAAAVREREGKKSLGVERAEEKGKKSGKPGLDTTLEEPISRKKGKRREKKKKKGQRLFFLSQLILLTKKTLPTAVGKAEKKEGGEKKRKKKEKGKKTDQPKEIWLPFSNAPPEGAQRGTERKERKRKKEEKKKGRTGMFSCFTS